MDYKKNIKKIFNTDYFETKIKEVSKNELYEVEINLKDNVFGYDKFYELGKNGLYFISIFKATENKIKMQIGVK